MTTYIDPENYSTREAVREADTDTLYAAFDEARRVFNRCGGHKLAARMFGVMETVKRELNDRDLPMPGPAEDPAPRCQKHPAYEADYCPVCGTTVPISERTTPETERHDYEPGEATHPMHTAPLCRVCGKPARNH